MPHLSELAKQYADKVIFIGVDIWEKGVENKLYESVLPSLKEFISGMGDKMAYNVAMDNNDLHMANNWMKASGQAGIPATFLIKDGRIIWIGHPMKLDKILENVFSGTYDMEGSAKAINQDIEKQQGLTAPLLALNKKVDEAIAAKDYSTALNDIENGLITIDPMFKILVYRLKFITLLSYNVTEAIDFAKVWRKENPSVGLTVGDIITKKDSLPKEAYQYALVIFTESISENGASNPFIYHFIAECYFRMNDLTNAVANEEKAIETGKAAIVKGEFQGAINAGTIKEYQDALAKYKAAQK